MAGVAFAVRGADDEIALAVDGQVERALGPDHGTFREIPDEADIVHDAEEIAGVRIRLDDLGEDQILGLEPGGPQIRQIGRDHVHLAGEHGLAGEGDGKRIFHGFPVLSG